MMKPKAAILGAGPSAAYALAACKDLDVEVDIYSNRPSFAPNGRVWFHKVPRYLEATLKPEPILLIGAGSRDVYLQRQNRPSWAKTTFPVGTPLIQQGYDPAKVRNVLMPADTIYYKLDHIDDKLIVDIAKGYHWVFLSFPTEKSKQAQPALRTYHVLTRDDSKVDHSYPNVMIFNGTMNYWWTRWSCIFGVTCWEFSSHEYQDDSNLPNPPVGAKYEKSKDFAPNTFLWDPREVPASNVYLIGRWATWNKLYLTHMAYDDVTNIIRKEL